MVMSRVIGLHRLAAAIVIGLAGLGLGACGDAKLEQLEAIRDEVCACKTVDCGEAALKKVPQDDITSNHRSQRVAREMLDCMAELYAAGAPTTDPDAAGSAAP